MVTTSVIITPEAQW